MRVEEGKGYFKLAVLAVVVAFVVSNSTFLIHKYYEVAISSDVAKWITLGSIIGLTFFFYIISVKVLIRTVRTAGSPGQKLNTLIALYFGTILVFAALYYLIDLYTVDSSAFNYADGIERPSLLRPLDLLWHLLDFLYFSVITATTVGYGDFTPNNTAVRLVTASQSLMSMYTAVVGLGLYFAKFAGPSERISVVENSERDLDSTTLIYELPDRREKEPVGLFNRLKAKALRKPIFVDTPLTLRLEILRGHKKSP